MAHSVNSSINLEINRTQEKVYRYLYRVEVLEKLLKNKEMSMEERLKLESELAEVKEGIKKSEEDLKNFYGQNRKTFMFAVLLMFFSFLIYGLYMMITNPHNF